MAEGKAKLKVLEVDEAERSYLQQIFLDALMEYCKFSSACNALQNMLKDGGKAKTVVAQWVMEDEAFRTEFEKAKKIVEFIAAEEVEEFLIKMGTGEQKTRKEDGYSTANPISGHMFLEAVDHQKWSSKAQKAVKKNDVIPRIEFHDHPGRTKKENDTD